MKSFADLYFLLRENEELGTQPELIGKEYLGQFAVGRRVSEAGKSFFKILAVFPDQSHAQRVADDEVATVMPINDETLPYIQVGLRKHVEDGQKMPVASDEPKKTAGKSGPLEPTKTGMHKYVCDDCGGTFMRHRMEDIRAGSRVPSCKKCGSRNVHPSGQKNWWEE